jgi:hypothetical protein
LAALCVFNGVFLYHLYMVYYILVILDNELGSRTEALVTYCEILLQKFSGLTKENNGDLKIGHLVY